MNYSKNSQKKGLSKSIKNQKLSHAYIICGGTDTERSEYIKNISKEIFCMDRDNAPCNSCVNCRKIDNGNMEDLITIEKDGNSIKVSQIKELASALANKPFTSRTVAIIDDADSMTPESQNKLLKSLEEPAAGNVIILSSANIFGLFPTIRSRCVIINIGTGFKSIDSKLDEAATNIVRYSMMNKPLGTIFDEVKNCVDSTSEAEKLLNALELFVRDLIIGRYSEELLFDENHRDTVRRIDWSKGYHFKEYLEYIETAKNDLKRNINWKYSLKNLILNLKQEERHG